jgi:hypothetical protein
MPDIRLSVFRSLLALTLCVGPQAAAAANQVVTNCSNDAELRGDLTAMESSGGGTLTFSCGTATIVLTADTPAITTTSTVDGGGKITISGGNSRRIFVVDDGARLSLKNIVLSNGATTGDGGAIASFGELVLQHVTIRNSSAVQNGGAMVTYGSTQIDDSELHSNTAENGGAIYARFPDAPFTIRRSVLHDNHAMDTGDGGAIFMDGAKLTIEDSEIHSNLSAGTGGGIDKATPISSVTIERAWIHDNEATGDGGGVRVVSGPLTIVDSIISGNSTLSKGGGIVYREGSTATIDGTTIHDNYADQTGGGVFFENSTGVVLTNTTVSSNESKGTAGLVNSNTGLTLLHVTFALNASSGAQAGGLSNFSGAGRNADVTNSLFAGNAPVDCDSPGVLLSGGGNVVSDESCPGGVFGFNEPTDQSSADVRLGPLGLHGGPTPTHVPGPGSEAVDAAILAKAPPLDQRGVVRPQGASADAGAVEVAACSASAALCGDANGNQDIAAGDALQTLRFAVGAAESCDRWLCDYDGSGSISASDALSILRTAVGQEVEAKCPAKWDCHALD